jgi:ribosome-associated heat shock protein Hsp15
MSQGLEKLRIDKYLWSIRLFKTRSLATDACRAGRVKLDGQNIKPSYLVKIGETFTIQKGIERKVIKVVDLLERRVDAKTAALFYEDLTPIEETHAYKSVFHAPILRRDRGAGRPTKRDRREIDDLQHRLANDEPINGEEDK